MVLEVLAAQMAGPRRWLSGELGQKSRREIELSYRGSREYDNSKRKISKARVVGVHLHGCFVKKGRLEVSMRGCVSWKPISQ